MRSANLQKNRSFNNLQGRSYSPNSLVQRNNYSANNNVSVHSEHLWNMMEDVQLFPDQIYQLLRYEERNLSNYKKSLQREKAKVNQEIDSWKKEIIHHIQDLRISIFTELDRIYRHYMQKYATLKGEIMEIKRMKDQIEMDLDRRSNNFIPKYQPQKDPRDRTQLNFKTSSINSNNNIMKSLEKNNYEVKKFQMLNYIAELQKEKIIPLNDITAELMLLTQYENGFYQNKNFQNIIAGLVNDLKANLRTIYERKYQFIREPQQICQREETPILDGIYDEPPIQINPVNQVPINQMNPITQMNNYRLQQPAVSKLDDTKLVSISQQQQNVSFDWAQNIVLTPTQTIKSISQDIILCSLQVGRNIMAVGGKQGIINIYQISTGQKIANLRGHRASICKLAMVSNNGKKYLASGSDHGCSSIVLWDILTWNMKMRIQGHKAAVTAIVDLQDNRSLISGSYDKTINVYDLNDSGKLRFNLPVNKTSVTAIILNCTGNKMISCGLDDTLNVWQVVRGSNKLVQTMFLERIIQNNTMICSILTSILQPDIVFLGTKDGKVKFINIDKGELYKTHNVCNTAVIQIVAIERQTKPDFPIILSWPCSEECIKVLNGENGKVTSVQTKGFIQFGCGIGPKGYMLSNGRTLAMLSQSRDKKEVSLFKLDVIN